MTYCSLVRRHAEPLPAGIPAAESWSRDFHYLNGPTGHSPVVNSVHAHWDSIRGVRLFPRRNEIDPVKIWAALPYLRLVDYLRNPLRIRMALIGSEIARQCRGQREGCFLDQMKLQPQDLVDTAEAYTRAHDERRPVYGLSRMLLENYAGHVFEWAIFPLSQDGENITGALTADDYTAVADRHPIVFF